MPNVDIVRKNGLQVPCTHFHVSSPLSSLTLIISHQQWPPHKLQVLTWILFPITLAHFYGFLRPLIWYQSSLGVALIVVFSTSCVTAVAAGYTTCLIDPSDDCLLNNSVETPSQAQIPAATVYCYLCESNLDKTSKHCRYCHKCVIRFDHHCKWLNTCVGAKNYFYFLSTIFSVCAFTTISLGLSLAFLVEVFSFEAIILGRLEGSGERGFLGSDGIKAIAIISVGLLLPLVALVYQLVGFHCMLICSNLTTYEFIVQEQKRQRERLTQRVDSATQQAIEATATKKIAHAMVDPDARESSSYDALHVNASSGVEWVGNVANAAKPSGRVQGMDDIKEKGSDETTRHLELTTIQDHEQTNRQSP